MEENKGWIAKENHKYTIKITVFENSLSMEVDSLIDYKPNYHEVIGALEALKMRVIIGQTKKNLTTKKKKR